MLTHGHQKDIQIRGIGSCQVQRNLHSPNSGSWTKASLPQELMKPCLTKVSIPSSLAEGTNSYLWRLLEQQRACWPPGSSHLVPHLSSTSPAQDRLRHPLPISPYNPIPGSSLLMISFSSSLILPYLSLLSWPSSIF